MTVSTTRDVNKVLQVIKDAMGGCANLSTDHGVAVKKFNQKGDTKVVERGHADGVVGHIDQPHPHDDNPDRRKQAGEERRSLGALRRSLTTVDADRSHGLR